jgi:hypothetical protein
MLRIILLNYKRPNNVKAICDSLCKNFKITVINNNPTQPFSHPKADVINNTKNKYCIERWVRCFDYPEEYKLILDDDLMPHPLLIKKMYDMQQDIVGIYGKHGVSKAKHYKQLKDVWCTAAQVDFLVGSVIMVKQSCLDSVKSDILANIHLTRGDDILVSYLIKKLKKYAHLPTVSGKVLNLGEGDVGLNKHPDHFTKRWEVLQECLS